MAVRAINTAGAATTGIVVDGVSLGDAVAGYTSLTNAIAASSNGDTLVYTEAAEFSTAGITTALVGLTITAADNVRWTGGKYGTGARFTMTGDLTFTAASGTTTISNLGRKSTINGYVRSSTGNTVILRRLVILHEASGYGIAIDQGGGTIKVDNCLANVNTSAGNTNFVWCFGSDKGIVLFNTTIVFTGSTTTAILVRGNSGTRRPMCANVQALKTNAAATPTYYFNAIAHDSYPTGRNMSSGATAPGTTTYVNVAADDILANVATLDMRWKDRVTAELYPGVDVSADVPDYDAEFQSRGDEWFVGADWIESTAVPAGIIRRGFQRFRAHFRMRF